MNKITVVFLCIILFPYVLLCLSAYSAMFDFIVHLPICFYIGKKRYGYTFFEILNRMHFAEIKFSSMLGSEPIPYDFCLSCTHYNQCLNQHCQCFSSGERSDVS